MTTKHVWEVYWKTSAKDGRDREYSRYFNFEILAVPFWAEKKRKTATKTAFVRELAVDFDERGRASEIRLERLICAYTNA